VSVLRLVVFVAFASLLVLPVTARAQPCVVRGAHLSVPSVRVSPRGGASFALALTDVSIAATAGARPHAHALHVDGSFVFDARTADLRYALSRQVTTAAGMLHLSTAARLDRVRGRAGGVVARVTLDGYVRLRRVALPCAALTLDAAPEAPVVETAMIDIWEPSGHTVTLRRLPGRGAALRVDLVEPGRLRFVRLARQGDYFEVRWTSRYGSRLRGWIHRSELQPMRTGSDSTERFSATRGISMCGHRLVPPGPYSGPARVAAGTPVYASRQTRRPWATAHEIEVEVVYFEGDPMVRLRRVPASPSNVKGSFFTLGFHEPP
jgi:hypothetical protein